MILLSGHSLTPERKVPLEAMTLQLKERESAATMSPADMTGIGVNSWFLDDKEPGAGIVWRVKGISQEFRTNTPKVQLEHVINTLRDQVVFGEVTAATITGNTNATECTAEQAVRYILSYQRDWVLGGFGYNISNPYKFDGETLFDALETVSDTLEDAWWSYDLSVYPFRLFITPNNNSVGSEMRAGRNLTAITKTIDKSEMVTRFYPIGKDDLHISGDYVERNTSQYGVVSKVETDTSIETEAELRSWALQKLGKHCEPTVTIDIEGLELSGATGETLDKMTLGRACRVPLPEFGTEITERIVSLNFPDKVHQPEVVKITLANNRTDITRIVADAIKNGTGGKGGRTAAKQQKEDHAWFEDTDEHVAMCAMGIIGRDADGNPDWYRLSQIVVDGQGIHQSVEEIKAGDVVRDTRIEQNEQAISLEANQRISDVSGLSSRITIEAGRITSEVNNRISSETQLSSRITQTANAITSEVTARQNADNAMSSRITQTANAITAEVTRATTAEGNRSSRITVNAQGIETKVSKNGVISSINQSAESVTINASKINLNGYVTTSELESAFTSAQQISTQQMTISQYFTCLGYNTTWKSKSIRFCSLGGEHTFKDTGGTSYTGRLVTDYSESTIYYLGR